MSKPELFNGVTECPVCPSNDCVCLMAGENMLIWCDRGHITFMQEGALQLRYQVK